MFFSCFKAVKILHFDGSNMLSRQKLFSLQKKSILVILGKNLKKRCIFFKKKSHLKNCIFQVFLKKFVLVLRLKNAFNLFKEHFGTNFEKKWVLQSGQILDQKMAKIGYFSLFFPIFFAFKNSKISLYVFSWKTDKLRKFFFIFEKLIKFQKFLGY
jgi:hypothetical protein